jgi:hypothetical protein
MPPWGSNRGQLPDEFRAYCVLTSVPPARTTGAAPVPGRPLACEEIAGGGPPRLRDGRDLALGAGTELPVVRG